MENEKKMIEKIEIKYFRSIYHISLNKLDIINIITGKNDVGKSNILRALNLFFNNCINKQGDYIFSRDFNYKRLEEVRKETIKGQQFIQIKITFNRGNQFEKTLPQRFTITKKWVRDSETPIITDDVEIRLRKEGKRPSARMTQSLNRFLNRINYVYVSAIKDNEMFDALLQQLQETVYNKKLSRDEGINESMKLLSDKVAGVTKELSEDFLKATNIHSRISTPRDIDSLYKTLHIDTKTKNGDVSIKNRGDGVQARYIPIILDYISRNTNGKKYIWGFEEPENSLEFNLARKMANDFYNEYTKDNFIILSTHSPAFIELAKRSKGKGFRCYYDNDATQVIPFQNEGDIAALSEELGYAHILMEQYEQLQRQMEKNEILKNSVTDLIEKINKSEQPMILTEGKTDVSILETAWAKLYEEDNMPFEIRSCSLTNEDTGKSTGGSEILKKTMCVVRHDQPGIIIGIFDNDEAGQKAFELDKNYEPLNNNTWKKHANGRGYAIILPTDAETEKIAESKKLCIEKMFDFEDIRRQVNGKRLKLDKAYIEKKANGVVLEKEEAGDEYWYLREINKASKIDFVDNVVPTLESNSFRRFKPLFEIILEIIRGNRDNN